MRTLLLVGAAALALTACSSTPAASPGFWDAHTVQGSMPDEPETIEQLASQSQLVVLGTINGVTEGKEYTDPGKPAHRTSNVAIQVEKSSNPNISKAVVEFSRQPETTLTDVASGLPQGKYVFYLQHWYDGPDGPVYGCTSVGMCAVGIDGGSISTPRDPGLAEDMRSEGRVPMKNQAPSPDGLTVDQIFTTSAAAVPAS
ncbi:hypothetical protein SK803_11635 [Lentzea sp. BCCO 10_0856]|uniref:Lipoprotein n=1 Tax=Lentzea miocenica TaxID=3095431 RepID=A0ABU4SY82_9PSEU|nr:hypothetical protein [Lentzea sp. BCCO 10_0856]MDX8030869.1 hypothetical protein [Lentzea sp. BCCO 10_0856]